MAAEELISEYIDLDATSKQTEAFLGQLKEVEAKFEKLNSIKLNLGDAAGSKQVVTNMKEAKKATEELTAENVMFVAAGKERLRIDNALVSTSTKIAALETTEAKALAILNKELKDHNAELKNQVRQSEAAEGSLEQLRARLILLQKEYDNLSKVERETSDGQALKNRVKAATDELKKLEGETGRFQRNVGNYSGAVKVLEKSLDDVNKKLKQNATENKLSADAVEMLKKEQGLLETFLERQSAAFNTSAMEIRENTKQLELLAAAGLQTSDSYRELFATTAALKDETADLKTALTNAAPDDVAINAATDAAKGLVGVYGLAQSATAIFGVENEALAETMVKLQAAETALQSIEAIRAVFKKENAVFQAKEIIAGKVLLVQKTLEGAAESKNIVIRYAAITAQKALNVVTTAAGGPLLIIVGVVAALIPLLLSWSSANEETAKSLTQVNAEMDKQLSLLDSYNDSISQTSDIAIANLRANFAAEKDIREAQIALIRSSLTETARFLTANRQNFEEAQAKLKEIAEKTVRTGQSSLTDDEKKAVEELTAIRDKFQDAEKRRDLLETQREVAIADNRRASIEEEIKVRQDAIEIVNNERNNRVQVLQDITNNEEKSYDERIAALNTFNALQKQISQDAARSALLDASLTPSERRKIKNAQLNEEKALERQRTTQVADLRKQEAARFRAAQLEIARIQLEDSARAQEVIADNEQKGYSERLDAAYSAFEKRRAILIAEHDEEMKIAGKTPEEKIALEKKYASDINALMIAYGAKQLELLQINQEQQTATIEQEQQKRRNAIQRNTDSATSGLNAQFELGLISITKYEKKREEIERAGRIALLKEEVYNTTARVILSKEGSAARIEAEAAWKNATLAYQDEVLAKDIDLAIKRREVNEQINDQVQETFKEAILSSYDRETNALEEQIAILEKKKQKDIEVATASIQNEQDRAAAIIVIEAKAQAEREAIERRQKQVTLERARTERGITIARIIADNAAAVIAALGAKPWTAANIGYAKAVGALGLLQLGAVLASAPKYKHGKNLTDTYEGPAWVGDGGKKELHVSDGIGTITPDTPTLTYVKKNDIIFPDAEQALRDIANVYVKPVPNVTVMGQSNDDVIRSNERIGKQIISTIRNKKEIHMQGTHAGVMMLHKIGQDHWKYIDEQVNFGPNAG